MNNKNTEIAVRSRRSRKTMTNDSSREREMRDFLVNSRNWFLLLHESLQPQRSRGIRSPRMKLGMWSATNSPFSNLHPIFCAGIYSLYPNLCDNGTWSAHDATFHFIIWVECVPLSHLNKIIKIIHPFCLCRSRLPMYHRAAGIIFHFHHSFACHNSNS